jgi:hypothetical protein
MSGTDGQHVKASGIHNAKNCLSKTPQMAGIDELRQLVSTSPQRSKSQAR